MGNKKVSINIEQTDDGCFSVEFSRGLLDKKHMVAETTDSLTLKVSSFLKSEFGAKT